jgi:hypothetical protein
MCPAPPSVCNYNHLTMFKAAGLQAGEALAKGVAASGANIGAGLSLGLGALGANIGAGLSSGLGALGANIGAGLVGLGLCVVVAWIASTVLR